MNSMATLIFFNGFIGREYEFIVHGNLFYKLVTVFDPYQDAGEVVFHVAGQYAVAFFGVHPGGNDVRYFPFKAIQPSHRSQMFRCHDAIYLQFATAEMRPAFCPRSQVEYSMCDVPGTTASPAVRTPAPES